MSGRARQDLDYLRAILATGVLIRGDAAWAVEAVCDHLSLLLARAEAHDGPKGEVKGDEFSDGGGI